MHIIVVVGMKVIDDNPEDSARPHKPFAACLADRGDREFVIGVGGETVERDCALGGDVLLLFIISLFSEGDGVALGL